MGPTDRWLKRWGSTAAGPGTEHLPGPPRALTAAGQRVNLRKPDPAHTRHEQWQYQSFAFRNTVPEMRFAGDFVASSLGRLRVFPAENRPRGEEPVPLESGTRRQQQSNGVGVDEATIDAAVAATERLNLNAHGASLLSRFAENLEYAGQCYLLGELDDDGVEQWSIRSILECQVTQGGGRIVDPVSGMQQRELPADEVDLMKLWTPDPAYYHQADAPVRGVLSVLRAMDLINQRGIAHDQSRISAGRGLFIPQELLMLSGPAAVSADLPGVIDDAMSDGFLAKLIEYMTMAIGNTEDPSAIVPLLLTGPATIDGQLAKDAIGTFQIHGEDPRGLDERYEALVMRFARGINLSPERIKGIAEASNTWSANVVTADEVKVAVEPRAERMCDSLTAAYLRPTLRAMGVPREQIGKVCLWFDSSELVQNPNRGEDAKALFASGELSGEALRRSTGFTEADKPSTQERLLRALSQERLANTSVPAILKLAAGQLPTVADLTALEQAQANLGPRPVVDVAPHRAPLLPPKSGSKPDPTPPVGQRQQPATASQPGALGASVGFPTPMVAAAWNPALHPRDHRGRFIATGTKVKVPGGREGAVVDNEVGGGKVRVRFGDGHTEDVTGSDVETTDRGPTRPGMRHYDPGADSDEMARRGVKVPPGYSNVQIAESPDSDLQWTGIDQKGREKREYSAAHKARQAAEKFERVKELDRHVDVLDSALRDRSGDDDTVAALRLIRGMGLRPGSDQDTRTEHKARGATNLLVGNVRVDGDDVTLDFIGKEGKHLVLPVDDPDLASMLRGRAAGRGGEERLFDTDETKVRAELKRHAPQSQVKDLRTYLATETAYELVRSMPRPTTKREYQAARNQVGDVVSKKLGNTRVMALASYINPVVFADWDAFLGAGGR